MTAIMISGTTPPTTPPTIAAVLFFTFRLPEALLVGVGGEVELDDNVFVVVVEVEGRVLDLVLLLVLRVFIGPGVASGSRPTDIAAASLYVWFGRSVTSMNAHRGTSVPGGTL